RWAEARRAGQAPFTRAADRDDRGRLLVLGGRRVDERRQSDRHRNNENSCTHARSPGAGAYHAGPGASAYSTISIAAGCQLIGTCPGWSATRLSQVRIDGKPVRSNMLSLAVCA